jgi:ubiquinone/menaquinone biosynthesis C-methylase UbiE
VKFSAEVETVTSEHAVLLWHNRTGRCVELPTDTIRTVEAGGASKALIDRLDAEAMFGGQPLDGRVLVRSRRPLFREDRGSIWFPLPLQPTAGGHCWGEMLLDAAGRALWLAIDDRSSVERTARRAGVTMSEAWRWLAQWTLRHHQIVQLRIAAPSPRESLDRLVGPPRPTQTRSTDVIGAHGETTLVDYHLAISDGPTHFDDVETTVAHAHGLPHPAFANQTYGEALYDSLRRRGAVRGGVTVEVGCGDGELARDIAPLLGTTYLRADLSPNLLRTQASRAPTTSGVLADATQLPIRSSTIDLLISNEVIADLTSTPWDGATPPPPELAALMARFSIRPYAKVGWYNVGAWRFLVEIARVLRPGGAAWLSEFGHPTEIPEEAVQLDHPEVGIHFGHLTQIATACGLRATVERLDDFLGVDTRKLQLARYHHEGLRAMCRAVGTHLPARAWTPEHLLEHLPFPVSGLRWVPASEPGAGPLMTRFYCLYLEKPD